MKKPKHKKHSTKPAKDSLIVDYGNKRVVMPYRVSLENYYEKEIAEIHKWCQKTFGVDTYYQSGGWPGYMYFVKESDTTMFRLMWSR